MHGSNLQRVARLAGDLCVHPHYIPKYLTTSLLNKRTPLELQLPWFSYSAIGFIESFLDASMRVFEYGGGGSTIFFAKRAAHVTSTESSGDWAVKIGHVLEQEKIRNVTLQVHPFDPNDLEAFARSSYLSSLLDQSPDVIVVDGYEESVPLRPACFRLAETVIKPGGIILVDDSWRYADIRKHHRAKLRREFRSVGPCRLGSDFDRHLFLLAARIWMSCWRSN